jgi:membrane-associated phospholipid phosphatase
LIVEFDRMFRMKELIKGVDLSVLRYLYSLRTEYLNNIFLFFTVLGSAAFISVFIAFLGLYLVFRKKIRELIFLAISIGGTYATVYVLKIIIGRARPAYDIAFYIENSLSFPSAHAAIASAFYGSLAFLLLGLTKERWQKKVVLIVSGLLILFIGLSRMYLGVHYLSDVIGGYIVGSVWLCFASYISKKITA